MEASDELLFRPFNGDDLPFLHSSWGHSYFKGGIHAKHLTPDEFHSFHRPIRERFFSRPTATVIVCADASDPWHIVAWIGVEVVPSGVVLQYLYVKDAFKGQGISSQLIKRAIPSSPIFYTHMTQKAARILAKNYQKYSEFIHIPHLV